jgi:hypothetical protein
MIIASPMLACSSMHLSAGFLALLYSVIGIWVISFVLALVNLCLIAALNSSARFKVVNVLVFSIYVILAFVLCTGGFGDFSGSAILFAIFGIPVLVIAHFVFLFLARRILSWRSPTRPKDNV